MNFPALAFYQDKEQSEASQRLRVNKRLTSNSSLATTYPAPESCMPN
jgi:hypothetical protein